MKLWQKLSLAILTLLILIIISLSFLVKSRITSEIIETLVIPQLEEITKHTISFNTLEVGWQGTITVKNLSLREPKLPRGAVVLQSQEMALHCRLLPLLTKKIVIEELTLHQPQINLTRDNEGNYTLFQDTPESDNKLPEKKKADKASFDTTLSLTITRLNIEKGTFIFTDHFKTSSSPFQLTLKRIALHASDISPVSSFPVDLSAEIVSDRPSFINLDALVDPLRKEVESKVELSPLDIIHFAPYFPELPFTFQQGYCSLDLTLTADTSLEFNSDGLLSLSNLSLAPLSTPDNELSDTFVDNLQNITIDLDHHLSYKPSEDTIVIDKLNLILQKIRLSLEGKIKTFTTSPLYEVTVKTENLEFQDMLDSVPRGLMPDGENLIASGTTGAYLSIKGSPEKPEDLEINGSLLIDKLTVQSRQTPSCKTRIDGKISLNSQEITIEHFEAMLKDSPLTLEGRIHDYLKGHPTAEFRLSSPSLLLDDIIPCMEEKKDERSFPEEERDEKGPFNFKLARIRADISFDSVNYKNIRASDVKARCRLDDNVLYLESLEGKIGKGALNLNSRIDLAVKGLDYTLQLTGKELELHSILTSFAPDIQEDIQGVVSFTSDFQGKGTTSDTFKKNLKGKGSIDINAATVANLNSLKSLSSFIKLDKLGTLRFDQSHGTFQIADGLAHTKNNLKGNEIELYPEGTISLDSVLDLILEMRLAPVLSEQIANEALTKYFKDERGWTVISLAIKGPADEVVIVPASSTIKNISEMLIDILLKKEDVDSDQRQDKKKALEDLLKGLIKKSKEAKPEEGNSH